jgi:alanine racemase
LSISLPTWIEIDLNAIIGNCANILRDTGVALIAIDKGDAYGHGALEVSRAALAGGASWLGVARFSEARELRLNGIQAPILVLGMAIGDEVNEAIAMNVTLTLHGRESLQLYAARTRAASQPLRIHLKVDTGMGRLGVFSGEIVSFARQVQAEAGLLIDGIFSHLASAEETGHPLNDLQHQRFQMAVDAMDEAGLHPTWVHLANSAGAFYLPETRYNMVRVGNVILGLRIRIDQPLPAHYRPTLTWKARLASCRLLPAGWGVGYGQAYTTHEEEFIGVVPVGYGDGLRRLPGNQVLIGGEKCPVVGRLCLDQLMVRLPGPYPMSTEVVIIGEQGDQSIWVHDLAGIYQTSQVDVTTHNHQRVPRIFIGK